MADDTAAEVWTKLCGESNGGDGDNGHMMLTSVTIEDDDEVSNASDQGTSDAVTSLHVYM